MKGHLLQACKKKTRESQVESLASSFKSAKEISEATDKDLAIDSSSTDHVKGQKNWFENARELDTNVTNPGGGNTKVLGIGEVEILARDTQGDLTLLGSEKALFASGYQTNLVLVSSIVDNG